MGIYLGNEMKFRQQMKNEIENELLMCVFKLQIYVEF